MLIAQLGGLASKIYKLSHYLYFSGKSLLFAVSFLLRNKLCNKCYLINVENWRKTWNSINESVRSIEKSLHTALLSGCSQKILNIKIGMRYVLLLFDMDDKHKLKIF